METSRKFIMSTMKLNEMVKAGQSNLRILNSTFVPTDDGQSIHDLCHIPTSKYFDVKVIRDTDNKLPFMLSNKAVFVENMKKLDVSRTDTVVFYDT